MTRSEALKSKKELQMMISKKTQCQNLTYKQDLERAKRNLDLAEGKNLAVRQAENIEQERASITHQFHDTLNEKKQMIEQLEQANEKAEAAERTQRRCWHHARSANADEEKMDRMHDRDQANVRTLDSPRSSWLKRLRRSRSWKQMCGCKAKVFRTGGYCQRKQCRAEEPTQFI